MRWEEFGREGESKGCSQQQRRLLMLMLQTSSPSSSIFSCFLFGC